MVLCGGDVLFVARVGGGGRVGGVVCGACSCSTMHEGIYMAAPYGTPSRGRQGAHPSEWARGRKACSGKRHRSAVAMYIPFRNLSAIARHKSQLMTHKYES